MDTINSQVSNNPNLDDGEKVITASDVVDNILNNTVSDYDINDFMSLEDQAECFREIVGIWASRDNSGIGRTVVRIDMTDCIEAYLLNSVRAKGYPS